MGNELAEQVAAADPEAAARAGALNPSRAVRAVVVPDLWTFARGRIRRDIDPIRMVAYG